MHVWMWMIIILILFVAQMVIVLFVEYRNPSKTVAWLTIMIVIPVIGFVLYYYLAKSYRHRRRVRQHGGQMSVQTRAFLASQVRKSDTVRGLGEEGKQQHKQQQRHDQQHHEQRQQQIGDGSEWKQRGIPNQQVAQTHPRMFAYLDSLSDAPMTYHNEVKMYAECQEAYTAMLAAIREAVDHIHLQFYTIRADRIGRCFQTLLIAKSLTGVKVRVLVDGVGSYHLDRSFIQEMEQAGIEVSSFLPPFITFLDKRVNYRNHRKILIIDGKVGFIGGMNIGVEYMGGNKKLGYWRDTHMRVMGDAVYYIQIMFTGDWALSTGQAILELPSYYPEHSIQGQQVVQIVASGPDRQSDAILEMFFVAIASAKKSIYLTSPYFIPDRSLMMALITAAKSGVDVRLIMPFKADSLLVHWASLSYMNEMMQAGVKCYLYRRGFIHAKVLIIDKVMATVGTANMDMRSFFSNFEMNAVLFDPNTITSLLHDFEVDQSHSTLQELEDIRNRGRLQTIKEVGARLLSPLL